jgi:hypothetical protein
METKKWICDICGEHATNQFGSLQVIFDHDQEDGKSKTEPYFDTVSVHLCDKDRDWMMAGNYIYAYGAMGYNKYSFLNTP